MNLADAGREELFRNLRGSDAWLLLTKLNNLLTAQGIESYVVGGWVRDVMLGRNTADIDITLSSDALEIAPRVAEALGGRHVILDKENRVGRVVLTDRAVTSPGVVRELDFATLKGDIETDLARRDFTIDAMAINLDLFDSDFTEIKIIDPFSGQDDLARGIIRVVAVTAFAEDALRLLRAVRLAAELNFNIEEDTESLVRRDARLITAVAGERVREELLRLLAAPASGRFLVYLDGLELLTVLFPELEPAKGLQQPKEHFWDVFQHSLQTVQAVDFLLDNGNWEYADETVRASVPWSEKLARHFDREVGNGSTGRVMLKLAALLHDVNKPQTRAIDAGGRMRFLGHARDGAVTAAGSLKRLRFSAKEIKLVETEVMHHLRPMQMSQEGLPSRRAIYRYFRDTGDAGIDILFLSLADHLAARGPSLNPAGWQEHTGLVDYVIHQRFEQENIVRPPKLIDGHDIMNIFGVAPGKEVGELLEAVREAQASGAVTSREEALSFIEELKRKNA